MHGEIYTLTYTSTKSVDHMLTLHNTNVLIEMKVYTEGFLLMIN